VALPSDVKAVIDLVGQIPLPVPIMDFRQTEDFENAPEVWALGKRKMPVKMTKLAFSAVLLFCSGHAFAQSVEKEPSAIIEIGTATERSLKDATSSFGPSLAVEVTPIENWLELEGGVAPLFNRRSSEWDVDLLFKKPWSLSSKTEFMVGLGPEWVHTSAQKLKTNSVAGEAVLDFMFWPSAKHRFGWFIEPAYAYSLARGHEQTLSVSGGLLIAIR
jgi:hypothetical protein